MSTHDKVISNDTFPNVRSDLNAALAALASIQAGTADPSAMLAYELQARTDLGVIRRRNAANSGWVNHGTLAETHVQGKSSNYTAVQADHQTMLDCTGTITISFTAAATLATGWHVIVRNSGTGVVTLDPNSTEQVDGATTLALYPGETALVLCSGSAFKTFGLRGTAVKLGNTTRDLTTASGTQAVTGVGFKPRAIMLLAGFVGGASQGSVGYSDGSAQLAFFNQHNVSSNTWGISTTNCVLLYSSGANYQTAQISALGDDGFTLDWTKTGSPTGTATVAYVCIR